MNPTSLPTPPANVPTPPVVGTALVEYMRTNRDKTAYILLGLSAVFLVLTIWMSVKAFQPPAAGVKKEEKKEEVNPFDPMARDDKKTEVTDPKRSNYIVGGIAGLAAFLVTAAAGAWVLVGLPNPSEEAQRSEARKLIIVVGGCIGAAVIFVGVVLFYMWSDALAAWLDKDEKKSAWRVMLPLTMIIAGAGLIFLAAQPARAEERNNANLRRMVYGANFGLTVLLVLVLLVVGNVVFALKAPNTLDATATGFYTLSDTTKGFIGQLPQPVTAYMVMQEGGDRVTTDIRQVLLGFQDAGGGKFSVRFVNPVTDKQEVRRLTELYKKLDKDAEGVLLVVGPEDQPERQRTAFISDRELVQQRGGGMTGGKSSVAFVGEGRILRDLRFLLESETKPVVYFTQGNGELSLGAAQTDLTLPAAQLQTFLTTNYSLEVKPLPLPATEPNPKVPDDCGVLVVADPQNPLPEPVVTAIRRYMSEKKGRLVVLSGTTSGLTTQTLAKTGLEGLLTEYNVALETKVVYASPRQVRDDPLILPVMLAPSPQAKQHQIVQTVAQGGVNRFKFPLSREVRPIQGNPTFQAVTLMQTFPGLETWVEDDFVPRPSMVWAQLERSAALRQQKQASENPRSVMVAVSEGGTGRVVVIGNGLAFSDARSQLSISSNAYDLVGQSIDWLRERPPVPPEIGTKEYVEYNFPDPLTVDYTRLLYLPVLIGVLAVAGLGSGVWVIRRK
jgi:hypothetical protein